MNKKEIKSYKIIFYDVKRNINNCKNCNQLFIYINTLENQIDEYFYSLLTKVICNKKENNKNLLNFYKQNLIKIIDNYVNELISYYSSDTKL